MNLIEKIQKCFEVERVLYSGHARYEMQTDEFGQILDYEVYEAICDGNIIEEYPNDSPYPSVLILGKINFNRPIHIVCAFDFKDDQTIIITVYQPDPELWDNFNRRKK